MTDITTVLPGIYNIIMNLKIFILVGLANISLNMLESQKHILSWFFGSPSLQSLSSTLLPLYWKLGKLFSCCFFVPVSRSLRLTMNTYSPSGSALSTYLSYIYLGMNPSSLLSWSSRIIQKLKMLTELFALSNPILSKPCHPFIHPSIQGRAYKWLVRPKKEHSSYI